MQGSWKKLLVSICRINPMFVAAFGVAVMVLGCELKEFQKCETNGGCGADNVVCTTWGLCRPCGDNERVCKRCKAEAAYDLVTKKCACDSDDQCNSENNEEYCKLGVDDDGKIMSGTCETCDKKCKSCKVNGGTLLSDGTCACTSDNECDPEVGYCKFETDKDGKSHGICIAYECEELPNCKSCDKSKGRKYLPDVDICTCVTDEDCSADESCVYDVKNNYSQCKSLECGKERIACTIGGKHQCVDSPTDRYCGACDLDCQAEGKTCKDGQCKSDCESNDDCGDKEFCDRGKCVYIEDM